MFYQTELNYGADISDLTGENHQTELNYLADNLELIIYKTTVNRGVHWWCHHLPSLRGGGGFLPMPVSMGDFTPFGELLEMIVMISGQC